MQTKGRKDSFITNRDEKCQNGAATTRIMYNTKLDAPRPTNDKLYYECPTPLNGLIGEFTACFIKFPE
jgi:hypothetical protein